MKKIIILVFAVVLCGLQMQAQNTQSKSNNRVAKSSTPFPGHIEIEYDDDTKVGLAIQNFNSTDASGIGCYNDMSNYCLIGINSSSSPYVAGPNTAYLFTNTDLSLGAGDAEVIRIKNTGNVGIGTTTPTEKLDVNGKIAVTADASDEMVIINGDTWTHGNGPQVFGDGGDNFIMASKESTFESGGIYGDGDLVTIWSTGDGHSAAASALLAVCDEDDFDNADTDPYNNTALKWYLTETGGWIASDINRKENINAFGSSLDKISQLDVFTYNYKMNQEEVDKGQVNPEVVGIIAQDLHKVLPQAVNITENGEHFVNYNQVTPVLIGAINELSTSNEALQAENTELKNRLTQLEAAVEALTRE